MRSIGSLGAGASTSGASSSMSDISALLGGDAVLGNSRGVASRELDGTDAVHAVSRGLAASKRGRGRCCAGGGSLLL